MHEAKPSECPKGDRDSELEVCFKNRLFLQAKLCLFQAQFLFFAEKLLTIVRNRIIISQSDFGLKHLPTRRISLDNKNNRKKLYEYNNVLKSIDDCYRNIAKRYGFSEAAFWTLYTLRMEPGNITQSDVCTVLYQPKQTVNSALKSSKARGI